ncbi:probable MET13 - putative methylene tetrahydrofolate reductase [Ustilago trichophora]|uniref:Probable MET13 - putative methylene tetrahydrofolate reductase n=1 Tax=Ustilago trichophora TaxID=86804 RepID=A0A5C3EMC0_9BASI|nr:probable MET13 - putative methylene tetrahydrofolate reductase [Ustilago trichophora]
MANGIDATTLPPKGDTSWKITNKIAKAEKEGRIWWSFEYFPPRTAQGLTNLYDRIERMADLGPEFVDITWNAGGRTSDLTASLVKTVHTYIGLETCMHLTCTNMPREKIDTALKEAKEFGCRNILALRGDPPAGQSEWEPHAAGFTRAKELVEYIREQYGDYFAIAVAGFPEGHPEAIDGPDKELERLKEKIDAGADFIFTQMFYDFDIFAKWVKDVRAAGITCPIIPGVMPIQTYGGFQRATARFGTLVPQYFHDALDPVKDDDMKVREIGTRLVGDMCKKIVGTGLGISGLHIYTMNLEKGSRMLLDYLGLTPSVNQVSPLPWTPSLTPKRRDEKIRPIFWANRAKSYVNRTETWDEFPNGRWGDARSPAYGDVDAYGVKLRYSNEEAKEMWGTPTSLEDVKALFQKFCAGQVKALPWSETPVARETSVISEKLTKMNQLGFLTINSQPAVDGARSDDKVHGWGPKNGYVYQKAYLEFFVSPEDLDALIARIEADPQITYHAVNSQGDMRTNTNSEAPNAVTWGVFPHCEIIQPTIVESISFLAWKDEAYEIGRNWAKVYEPTSPSRKFLEDLFNKYFLVNVVHNDFKAADSIFEPFLSTSTASSSVNSSLSGIGSSVADAAGRVANSISSLANGVSNEHTSAPAPAA